MDWQPSNPGPRAQPAFSAGPSHSGSRGRGRFDSRGSRGDIVCYKCGGTGHIARNCRVGSNRGRGRGRRFFGAGELDYEQEYYDADTQTPTGPAHVAVTSAEQRSGGGTQHFR